MNTENTKKVTAHGNRDATMYDWYSFFGWTTSSSSPSSGSLSAGLFLSICGSLSFTSLSFNDDSCRLEEPRLLRDSSLFPSRSDLESDLLPLSPLETVTVFDSVILAVLGTLPP